MPVVIAGAPPPTMVVTTATTVVQPAAPRRPAAARRQRVRLLRPPGAAALLHDVLVPLQEVVGQLWHRIVERGGGGTVLGILCGVTIAAYVTRVWIIGGSCCRGPFSTRRCGRRRVAAG